MKLTLPIVLAAAVFAASPAFADEISSPAFQIREQAQSLKSRADVTAQLQAARAHPDLGDNGEYVTYGQHAFATPSTASRAAVAADAHAWRAAGRAQVGELAG